MAINGNQRAYLRAEANGLDSLLHIGKEDVNENIVTELHNLLRTRELVKVTVLKTNTTPIKELANELAESTSADIVQVIGRKFVLYRFSEELAKKGKTIYNL